MANFFANAIQSIKNIFSGGTPAPTSKKNGSSVKIDDSLLGKTHKGTLIFFNYKRGFGFISSTVLPTKIFVHISELDKDVKKGDKVNFSLDTDNKGYRAAKVKKS